MMEPVCPVLQISISNGGLWEKCCGCNTASGHWVKVGTSLSRFSQIAVCVTSS